MYKNTQFRSVKHYDKALIHYHFPQKKEIKSVFLQISGHIYINDDEPVRKLKNFYRSIRQSLLKLNHDNYFHEKYIVIEYLPDSFADTGLCCYRSEFTLFPTKKPVDKEELFEKITKYSDFIYENVIDSNKEYTFYRKRQDKLKNHKV